MLNTGPHITSLGVRLLADLRDLFARHGTDRLPTTVIINDLRELDEAPWGDLNGKPLDARSLSRELSRYGTRPHDLRMTGGVVKGYRADSPEGLADAWDRYLPPPPTAATNATPQVNTVAATGPVADTSATDQHEATAVTPHVADASATTHTNATGLTCGVAAVAAVADEIREAP